MDSTSPGPPQPRSTGAAYAALFLLGAAEGLIGCFQFSRSAGPVPVAALAFCLLIFATCLLAGWGMGTPLGGLVAALGWFAMSVVLTMPTRGGSVIVTNSAAGKWFLYGGAVCAGAGLAVTFRWRTRRPARARGRTPGAGS
ncbi:MAG TPA: hypothetical protein VIX86_05650 [Streptosporangiaceae bacterium]